MPRRVYTVEEIRGRRVSDPRMDDDAKRAKKLRETFTAQPSHHAYDLSHDWPKRWKYVGRTLSFAYSSDKWKRKPEFDQYKHLAEAEQDLYASPAAWDGLIGEPAEANYQLPTAIAELSLLIFFEAQLFVGRAGVFGEGDRGVTRVTVPGGVLYGGYAKNPRYSFMSGEPKTEPFLAVATKADGVLFVVTGAELDIERDGITG
jgi:hypothetical protein